jgi:hypothetical protein
MWKKLKTVFIFQNNSLILQSDFHGLKYRLNSLKNGFSKICRRAGIR